jgi:hypothetical protein
VAGSSGNLDIFVRIKQTGAEIFAHTSAAIAGVRDSIFNLHNAMTALFTTLSAGAFIHFAEQGEQSAAVTQRFRAVIAGLGLDADATLARLQAFSGGLIDNTKLMSLASQALTTGGFTMQQLGVVLEFTRLRAVATGRSVGDLAEEIMQGLAVGSSRALTQVFPDLLKRMQDLQKAGFQASTDKAEVTRSVLARMAAELPTLRDQVGGAATNVQQFSVMLHNLLSDVGEAISKSPAFQGFFKDASTWLQDLVKRMPELIAHLADLVAKLKPLSDVLGVAAKGWGLLLDTINATPQTIQASGLGQQIAEAMKQLDVLAPGSPTAIKVRDNIRKFLDDLAMQIGHGGQLQGLTQGQLAAVRQAFDQFDFSLPTFGFNVKEGNRGIITGQIQAALDTAQNVISAHPIEVPVKVKTAGLVPAAGVVTPAGEPSTLMVDQSNAAVEWAKSLTALNAQLHTGALTETDFLAQANAIIPSLRFLQQQTGLSDLAYQSMATAIQGTQTELKNLNPEVSATGGTIGKLLDQMEGMVQTDFFHPTRALNEWALFRQMIEANVAAGQDLETAYRNAGNAMSRVVDIGKNLAQVLSSAVSSAVTGLGNMFADILSGGDAAYHQQVAGIQAQEQALSKDYAQSKLTLEQYNLEVAKLAAQRADLDTANNPFKKFASTILGTLGDLFLGLAAAAAAWGLVQTQFLANPFAVGILLKAAASKIGGTLSGNASAGLGSTNAAGSALAAAGAAAGAASQPIINVQIVGQSTGEVISSVVYDSARYQKLGGRPTFQVPGVLVIRGK